MKKDMTINPTVIVFRITTNIQAGNRSYNLVPHRQRAFINNTKKITNISYKGNNKVGVILRTLQTQKLNNIKFKKFHDINQ